MNKKCQVFTPQDYVDVLLDSIAYNHGLYGKRILENSCGDGNVLSTVVQRYIDDCKRNGLSGIRIRNGLSRDIYGVEIDPEQYKKCLENLNSIVKINGIPPVKWNIFNRDYLKLELAAEFDYIVGNPPYITYSELSTEDREYLRKNFKSCQKGKFDYCYAFLEKSVEDLSKEGKMAYLIPSSIFKTVYGENLRKILLPNLVAIYDYTQEEVFLDVLVKSAIMVLDKTSINDSIVYQDMATEERETVSVNDLSSKWFFSKKNTPGTRRFGDYFQVSHVVATLFNEAYVLKKENYQEIDGFYFCNGKYIEKSIVRETATPRSMRYKNNEKIIFPYDYQKGKLVRFSSEQFSKLYPGAVSYLNDFREQLGKRKSDKGASWFEYGRSQALSGLNKRKLLISTVITERVLVYMLRKTCIPYAGMYIVPRTDNKVYKLEKAKSILESDEFMKYVQDVGIHISGSSMRITSKDIEEFMF